MSQPLEFDNFSGGITDYFVGAPLNKFEMADNLNIFKYADASRGFVGRLFTRPGSMIFDDDAPQIPAGSQRIGTLEYFEDTLLIHSARKFYYISGGSYTTIQGPSSNDVFPSGATVSHYVSTAEWRRHLLITNDNFNKVQKLFPNSSNVLTLRTAGMPLMASSPTVTPGAGGNTYIYRFYHEYTYTVGTLTYVDVGPTVEVAISSAAAPNASTVAITNIPVLANSTTHNYDTASSNLKIKIARTIASGSVFYIVGSVNNGTTSFNDSVDDATLQTNATLYTEDGSVERFEPPLCKYVHVTEDKAYFAHVKEGSEVIATRVYQSIPGDIDAIGEDFYADVDYEITGVSSFRGIPIIGTTNGVFRLEGAIDAVGRGAMIPRKISDTASCVSHQSMVQTPLGVFWAGSDGIYWSDGYSCSRVNDGWDKTYQEIVSTATKKKRIYAKYDPKKNRVYFACSRGAENLDNNALFVLHLDWGVSSDMPFTSWSGTSFNPSAIEVDASGNLVRGDKRGYVLIHSDTTYTDPKINTLVAASSWITETIIYSFKSAATNFGSSFERKWVTGMNLVAENETNLSLSIVSNNDKSRRVVPLAPVRFRGNLVWGDPDVFWGDPNIVWNYSGLISEKRRMPSGSLRCDYKQIELTNAKVALFSSDLLGTCDVNATLKTATLNTGTQEWPVVAEDYFISFEADGYVQEFTITARTDDVITFSDVQNKTITRTGQKFVIRGYPRNEVLFLIGFTIHYEMFGKTQNVYRGSDSGEVGSGS